MKKVVVHLAALLLAVAACAAPRGSEGTQPTTTRSVQQTEVARATSTPTSSTSLVPTTDAVRVWKVDPATLEPIAGTATEPVGVWVEHFAFGGDLLAVVGWNEESTAWALQLVDSRTGEVEVVERGNTSFVGAVMFEEAGDLLWLERREGMLDIRRYSPLSGTIENLSAATVGRMQIDSLAFLDGGSRIGIFGTDPQTAIPRVIVADSQTGETTMDVPIDTDPPAIQVRKEFYEWGRIQPAWDDGRDRLYVPHIGDELLSVVDLQTGGIVTSPITPGQTILDRLIAAWIAPALAKGPSSYETATLSPDGAVLYVTGSAIVWGPGNSPNLFREEPASLLAANPETMTELARADLPVNRMVLSPDGNTLAATGTWEDHISGSAFGSAGVYLLGATNLATMLHVEPPPGGAYYELAFSSDSRYLYFSEWAATDDIWSPRTSILDSYTLQITEAGNQLDRFHAELLARGLILKS